MARVAKLANVAIVVGVPTVARVANVLKVFKADTVARVPTVTKIATVNTVATVVRVVKAAKVAIVAKVFKVVSVFIQQGPHEVIKNVQIRTVRGHQSVGDETAKKNCGRVRLHSTCGVTGGFVLVEYYIFRFHSMWEVFLHRLQVLISVGLLIELESGSKNNQRDTAVTRHTSEHHGTQGFSGTAETVSHREFPPRICRNSIDFDG